MYTYSLPEEENKGGTSETRTRDAIGPGLQVVRATIARPPSNAPNHPLVRGPRRAHSKTTARVKDVRGAKWSVARAENIERDGALECVGGFVVHGTFGMRTFVVIFVLCLVRFKRSSTCQHFAMEFSR